MLELIIFTVNNFIRSFRVWVPVRGGTFCLLKVLEWFLVLKSYFITFVCSLEVLLCGAGIVGGGGVSQVCSQMCCW